MQDLHKGCLFSQCASFRVAPHLRVELNLFDGGDNGGDLEELLQPGDGDVGDTDGLDLFGVLLVQLLHLLVGVEPVDLQQPFQLSNQHNTKDTYGEVGIFAVEHGCGPVHEPYMTRSDKK